MTPERFRLLVSYVLVAGVGLSGALVAIAFAGSLAVGWEGSLVAATGHAGDPTDFGAVADGLRALRPIAIAQAGLLVLVATPVLRVAASVVAFALEGDRLYTAITLAVLAVLLTSLFVLR